MYFGKKIKFSHHWRKEREGGVSVIEIVVSLFVIILVLSIFSSSLISFAANQSNQNKHSAYNFAEAELAALNNYPFGNLTERTDGDFVGLAYNIGQQKIVSDAGAQSPTQVQSVAPAGIIGGGISSAILLPESYYSDFTFSAYLKILPSSASNWQTGIIFRYQDIENYYYWSITSSSMKLTKVLAGTATTLWAENHIFNMGAWHNLKVVTAGTSLEVYLDNILKMDQADNSFASGYLGFMGRNSTYYYLDNLHLESPIKNNDWFFDSGAVDSFPEGFLKISPADLAGLAGKLTIENYSGADIKKIIVKVTWQGKGTNKEVQLSTLRSREYE